MSSSDELEGSRAASDMDSLMGEANRCFIFSQIDQAISLLHDVITKNPKVPDPYNLLGVIYEEKKEPERAADFFRLAAQMTQHDSDLWAKVAYMYKDLGRLEDAIDCFRRAILNRKFPDMHLMKERYSLYRALCYEQLGKLFKAKKVYIKILKECENTEPAVAKALVEVYTAMKQPIKAIADIKDILAVRPNEELLHLLCELYIKQEMYTECLEQLERVQGDVKIDINVKRGYCLAKLGRTSEAKEHFDDLLKRPVGVYDDLYWFVGDLYKDIGCYEDSLEFLERLRAVKERNGPSLWLTCGWLYFAINDLESAEDCLLSVLESEEVEYYTDAKLLLSRVYQENGMIEKSIDILKQSESCEGGTETENIEEHIESVKLKIQELSLSFDPTGAEHVVNSLIEIELKRQNNEDFNVLSEIGLENFDFLSEVLVNWYNSNKNYSESKILIGRLLRLNCHNSTERKQKLKLSLAEIAVLDGDYDLALQSYKFICENEPTPEHWAILNSLLKKSAHTQLRTWLSRICNKNPQDNCAKLLLANNYMQTGYFSLAVKHYYSILDRSPTDHLVNFCLGLCYLFSLTSRSLQSKEEYFTKAFSHLKTYLRVRKRTHYYEAYYNYARAFHYLKYLTKATYYYEKILMTYSRASPRTLDKFVALSARNLASIQNSLNDEQGANDTLNKWVY